MDNITKLPRMISLREAEQESGVSYDRLLKLVKTGKVAHIWSGRKILINADRLAEYLNNNEG